MLDLIQNEAKERNIEIITRSFVKKCLEKYHNHIEKH